MKILVVDFLFVNAHHNFNENIIKALSTFAEIDVVNVNDFYEKKIAESNFINYKLKLLKNGSVGSRINSIVIMYVTLFYLLKKRKKYDAVFCLAFETVTTFFTNLFLPFLSKKIFLFHHKNIDELNNFYKKFLFKTYQKKFMHIVFENEFAQHLNQVTGLDKSHIRVIHHPLCTIKRKKEEIFDCVGLCNSNNIDFVGELCDNLKNESNSNMSFVIKCAENFDSTNNFRNINTFLPMEKYWEYIDSAKSVLVALPQSYKNRLSGSIYDALSMKKKVFTTSLYHASIYESSYPGICEFVQSANDLVEKVKNYNHDVDSRFFDKFIEDHSIQRVAQELNNLMKEK